VTALATSAPVRHRSRRHALPVDWGRVALVPLFTLLLTVNLLTIPHQLRSRQGAAMVVALAVSLLTVAFYLLVLWAYLRRGPATATTQSLWERTAAVVATALPLLLPVVAGTGTSVTRDVAAGLLMLTGLAVSVLALRALGRNLSVVPQARRLADGGPYRWVRHPLYTGELVTVLGIVVRDLRPLALVLWLVLVALQAYRAAAEERLLDVAVPGYPAYRAGTARFVPVLY
jgi:protein-S-isoprenylcysteine O-methyltransferase Ste14